MATPELSLADVRRVQLEVLAAFDTLCRAHGLTYYVAYGTLLGAVRHGGYIPWDDDVDVMMPRADFDRLHQVFVSSPPDHLTLGSARTRSDWPFGWAKVIDDRTELFEPMAEPLPLGVNLDVFPVDTVPASRGLRVVQAPVLRLLRWAVELRYIQAKRGLLWHRRAAITWAKPVVQLIPARTLVSVLTTVARLGTATGTEVGVRVGTFFEWSVPAEALGSPGEIDFAGLRVLAPADPEAVLTAMYGDFRQLPPEAQRVSEHAFTAIWRAG